MCKDSSPLVVELVELIHCARNGEFAQVVFVPADVQDLKFGDLPISVRLQGVLRQKRLTRLGDLHGIKVNELKGVRNCGKGTIAEILRLIEKAVAGGFAAVTEADVGWAPADLAKFIDALVAGLSPRDVGILRLRLDGEKRQWLTLEDVGAKFNLTRERIRQVIEKIAASLLKAGSRKLNAYLRHVEHACHELVCPLTPALWEQWLGEKVRDCRFSSTFYVRLLYEMYPAIPAWPKGQAPSAYGGKRTDALESAFKLLLQDDPRPVPLPEAFAKIQAKLRGLGVGEYLDILWHSRQIRVEFPRPDRPELRLSRMSNRAILVAGQAGRYAV